MDAGWVITPMQYTDPSGRGHAGRDSEGDPVSKFIPPRTTASPNDPVSTNVVSSPPLPASIFGDKYALPESLGKTP